MSDVGRAFQPFRLADGLGALSGIKMECTQARRFAPRLEKAAAPASQSGHLREPSLALTRPWSPIGFGSRQVTRFAQIASSPLPHCSARTTGRTRQLSVRSIRCRTQLRRLRWMLSLIPTAANCRDRHEQRCAQSKTTQAAMLRISAKTGNMAARLRPARTTAIAVSTASFRGAALAKLADLTEKTTLV